MYYLLKHVESLQEQRRSEVRARLLRWSFASITKKVHNICVYHSFSWSSFKEMDLVKNNDNLGGHPAQFDSRLYIYLSICLSIYLCMHLYVFLTIYLYILLSFYLSISSLLLFIHISLQSIHKSIFHLLVYLSMYISTVGQSIHIYFICLSVYLSGSYIQHYSPTSGCGL